MIHNLIRLHLQSMQFNDKIIKNFKIATKKVNIATTDHHTSVQEACVTCSSLMPMRLALLPVDR